MALAETRVAVIGTGPAGLSTIKSLLEEGFQVTGFDQRQGPGGIWRFTDDPHITSVTSATRAQLSRFLTPFSDFPHKAATSRHPSAAELSDYYELYADHFGLTDKIEYGTTITSVSRAEDAGKWKLSIAGEKKPRTFDKVVLAIGSENDRKWPRIDNMEAFQGLFIHGQEYKRPETFQGKKVIVIGQGNSACDCAVELTGHASQVYLAHHRGAIIVPRMLEGARFDKLASWKLTRFGFWLERRFPALHRLMFHLAFKSMMEKAWGVFDPEWRFENNYYYGTNISALVINDGLVPALREGRVISTAAVKGITGPHTVVLTDGTIVDDVDCIIACTGYASSLEFLGDAIKYSQPTPECRKLPRLYQNIFPIDYVDSFAYTGYLALVDNASMCRELAGMAIAQIWAGKSSLPSRQAMERQIDRQHRWYADRCRRHPIPQLEGLVEPHSWSQFVNDAAGTGVNDYLGWTWKGLLFSLVHPLLYLQLAWGMGNPHVYRFFETGKRRAWPGARDAIARVNVESAKDIKDSVSSWEKEKSS